MIQMTHQSCFIGNIFIDNYPLNSIKGKICSLTFIDEFEDAANNITYITKPKILIMTFSKMSFMGKK